MFGLLIRGAIHAVTAPIEVARDVVTLGGVLNDRDESYTERRLKQLAEDADDVVEEILP
jgi:hypothetical protein